MTTASSLIAKASKATVAATMAFALAIPMIPATSYAADDATTPEYQLDTQTICGPNPIPAFVTPEIHSRFSNFQLIDGFENIYVCDYDPSPTFHTRAIYSPDAAKYFEIGKCEVGSYLPAGAQYPFIYTWSALYGYVHIYDICLHDPGYFYITGNAQDVGFIEDDKSLPEGNMVITYRDQYGNDVVCGLMDRESYRQFKLTATPADSPRIGMAVEYLGIDFYDENYKFEIANEAQFNTFEQMAKFKTKIAAEGGNCMDVFSIMYTTDYGLFYNPYDEDYTFTAYVETPDYIKPLIGNSNLKLVRIDSDTDEYEIIDATIDDQYVKFKTTYSGDYAFVVMGNDEEGVQMHRLYNPNSGEHFYTSRDGERDHLVSLGWRSEGEGWSAPESGDPVYRLYNRNGGEHHYTMSAGERDMLVGVGWEYEGIGWYSDPSQGVPVYREYNPNERSNNHNYTRNQGEHNWLTSLGWRDEGIAWYGI